MPIGPRKEIFMISTLKIGTLGFGFSALLALAGCQSNGTAATPSHQMSMDAMRCDKCQVTWVKTPYANGRQPGAIGYHETQKMECPDCKDHMSNFFATGKIMEHHCTTCGGNMVACEGH